MKYTCGEVWDMDFVYGLPNGNSQEIRGIYEETHPYHVISHEMFVWL